MITNKTSCKEIESKIVTYFENDWECKISLHKKKDQSKFICPAKKAIVDAKICAKRVMVKFMWQNCNCCRYEVQNESNDKIGDDNQINYKQVIVKDSGKPFNK